MNIYQRMAAITAELQTVAKNLMVETGRGKGYKAVSERDIIDAVKPLEEKHGVYSYPCDRKVLESQTLESESTYNGNTTKKTTFFTRIQTTYRFVNVDAPEEFVETITFAEGIDAQDKGSGKAMTYGDKYALMKAYKISTGDDPDQNASEDTHYSKLSKRNAFSELRADISLRCEGCGVEIPDTWKKDGTLLPAADVAAYSVERFGRSLCPTCQKSEAARVKSNAN